MYTKSFSCLVFCNFFFKLIQRRLWAGGPLRRSDPTRFGEEQRLPSEVALFRGPAARGSGDAPFVDAPVIADVTSVSGS